MTTRRFERRIAVVRARPGGRFWVLLERSQGAWFERWTVQADGTMSQDLSYGPLPANFGTPNADVAGWLHLDGDGNMYRWVTEQVQFSGDSIAKFTGAATATLVFEEDQTDVCELHAFEMFTGP